MKWFFIATTILTLTYEINALVDTEEISFLEFYFAVMFQFFQYPLYVHKIKGEQENKIIWENNSYDLSRM